MIRQTFRESLRADEQKLGPSATYRQHNGLNDRRKALNDRVILHRSRRDIYMSDLGEPDHPKRRKVESADPEHAELGLPSSYLRNSLETSSLVKLADLEARLRRAVCGDALQSLRNLLGAKAMALRWKRQNVAGERSTTRAEAALKVHNEKVNRARWRYNNSRDALLRLGSQQTDIETYKALNQEDLRHLKDYLEQDSLELGQGYRAIPWIWRTAAIANEEEWQIEGELHLPLYLHIVFMWRNFSLAC
jgi:hypothetical protein